MESHRSHHLAACIGAIVLLTLAGCSKSPDQSKAPEPKVTAAPAENIRLAEGALAAGTYTHPGFGWSMKIPTGWRVQTMQEIATAMGQGVEALEKTIGEPIEQSAVNLLHLELNPFCQFTSTAQPYQTADGPYAASQQAVFDVLVQTYEDNKMKVEQQRREELIDGVPFAVLHLRICKPDGTEIMQQILYDALLGPRSLTVSITANNETDRAAMMEAWQGSSFNRSAWSH